MSRLPRLLGLFVACIVLLACNLPSLTPTPIPVIIYTPLAPSTPPPAPSGTPMPTPTIAHTTTPAEVHLSGPISYDVDSKGTAPEHRAPYGDSYKLNRFERPFTRQAMDYLPFLDIVRFRIIADATWYYVFVELNNSDVNNAELDPRYGVELDLDRDGHGDYLIWAAPPFSTTWSADHVQVFADRNHDTGGVSPDRSDAPYPGDGYETLIFDGGRGDDPDLAWVRIDPTAASVLQFAFKRTLVGSTFMWGVVADGGIKDPSKYYYNDRFTEEQAGSPEKNEKYYPIKEVYAVDNTCREAYGFTPTGYESLICPKEEPTPAPRTPRPRQPTATPTATKIIVY
ncbi:MAG: hypothetical protein D6770_03105 [Anaerolineae bacterium]|nr:MAG: hypothetical protein D6770_03105 [Anaerolineae bacterium]